MSLELIDPLTGIFLVEIPELDALAVHSPEIVVIAIGCMDALVAEPIHPLLNLGLLD